MAVDDHLLIWPWKEHHCWCNFYNRPIIGCEMCKGLWREYPYESNEEMRGLMTRHFPNNIQRT